MHLEQCPVCQGIGRVLDPFIPILPETTAENRIKTCHACIGKGFIQVYDAGDFETLMKIPELRKLVMANLESTKGVIDDEKEKE